MIDTLPLPAERRVHRDYDLELAVLAAMRPAPEYTFTLREIAAVCDVSPQAIRHQEQNALRKVRARMRAIGAFGHA